MGCIYKFEGNNKRYSYLELVREIMRKPIPEYDDDLGDLVFSLSDGQILQRDIEAHLDELKVEGMMHQDRAYFEGEPTYSTGDTISIQDFIDSPMFRRDDGKAYVVQMSNDDYIVQQAALYMSEHMSLEDARRKAEEDVENWQRIGADAADLHKIAADFDARLGKEQFQEQLRGTQFEDVSGLFFDSLQKLGKAIGSEDKSYVRGDESEEETPKTHWKRNINIKVRVEGSSEDLLCHYDLITIDSEGHANIYMYSVTTMASQFWNKNKLEKYKYKLALLKKALEAQGINMKSASLNIIPIRMTYSEDKSKIERISIEGLKNVTIDTSNIRTGAKYNFRKYDAAADKFIHSKLTAQRVTSDDEEEVSKQLQYIFSESSIDAEGIRLTALQWIKDNIRDGGRIRTSSDPEYAYEVNFGTNEEEDIVKIKSREAPEVNAELITQVENHHDFLELNFDVVMKKLIKEVKQGMNRGGSEFRFYGNASQFLSQTFKKYMTKKKTGIGEEEKNEWELVENDVLQSCGILLFRNNDTKLLDVVQLTPYDLRAKVKFRKGDHILGSHMFSPRGYNELIGYKSTYGNIEGVRGLLMLNQILPKLGNDFKLGKLHVISLCNSGQGIPFMLESTTKKLFNNVIKFVNSNLDEFKIKNNFQGLQFTNPFETLLSEYEALISKSGISTEEQQQLIDLGFSTLESANTVEARRVALYNLAESILNENPALSVAANVKAMARQGVTTEQQNLAKLYKLVLQSLRYYEVDEISPVEEKLNTLQQYTFVQSKVPNKNFLAVYKIYNKAINSISEQVLREIEKSRRYFLEFYDACGYSRAENLVIGDQAKTFENLYKRDEMGNRLLELKNPYSPIETLEDYEREFLKKYLFSINRIRTLMQGGKWEFTSYNDPSLEGYINTHKQSYFNVPLEKASKSTRKQNTSVKERLDYGWGLIEKTWRNPSSAYDYFVNKIDDAEKQTRDESIEAWQLRNKFDRGEGDGRANYILNYGVAHFETNLDKILVDFTEKYYEHYELNKALIISRAITLELEMLRDDTHAEEIIDQTEKMINDFLKVNVFNGSLMENLSKIAIGVLSPLKDVMHKALLTGNIKSMFRDTFEGVWQNTMRALTKYLTNIDAASLSKAYKDVILASLTDRRSINVINQLCLKYRLSNIDVSRISEGMRTEGGINNIDDWLYATLRLPDFLNRMVLFVAKCYVDGTFEAFEINDEGRLVYNWKKDKRFNVLASGDKNNPEYAKQLGLYYNCVRGYNKDHPENPISFDFTDDENALPAPYTNDEIETIKNVAASIYGSYDKSTKATYEHMFYGTIFGMFTTWMNGIYSNYFMKPGQYGNTGLEAVLALDDQGRKLFFDDNGLIIYEGNDGKYYYDGTNELATEGITNIQPVVDLIPIVVQGIIYSIGDAFLALKNGGLKSFKEEIWADPMQRKNLEKLLSDFLLWILSSMLLIPGATSAYKEYKKNDMKEHNLAENALVEALFKGFSGSFDLAKGPINLITYFGDSQGNPMYKSNIKIAKDAFKWIWNDKSAEGLIMVGVKNSGLLRSFQDAAKAEFKKYS